MGKITIAQLRHLGHPRTYFLCRPPRLAPPLHLLPLPRRPLPPRAPRADGFGVPASLSSALASSSSSSSSWSSPSPLASTEALLVLRAVGVDSSCSNDLRAPRPRPLPALDPRADTGEERGSVELALSHRIRTPVVATFGIINHTWPPPPTIPFIRELMRQ